MRVELIGFAQGVSLRNKDDTTSYLEFEREDGKKFRLPVPEDTLEVLCGEIYGGGEKVAAPAPTIDAAEHEEEATSFGGDLPEEPEEPEEEEEDEPESEDDVPSI